MTTNTSPKADPQNLPNWRDRMHLFDSLEISPCVTNADDTGASWIEICDNPADAEFWSVYGHYNPRLCDDFGGVDCLEDFKTDAEAHAFAEELYRTNPHLRRDPPR